MKEMDEINSFPKENIHEIPCINKTKVGVSQVLKTGIITPPSPITNSNSKHKHEKAQN